MTRKIKTTKESTVNKDTKSEQSLPHLHIVPENQLSPSTCDAISLGLHDDDAIPRIDIIRLYVGSLEVDGDQL